MKSVTEELLKLVSNWKDGFKGAFNIREDGGCAGRQSTEHIQIDSKKDLPGLDIHIQPGTKGETVSIPACVTHGDVDDLVYNDFYVGEYADVTIVAGCGVHTENGEPARHNGIHRFFLEKGARVKYIEKHVGTGKGAGIRSIDPVTECFLKEDAVLEMDTSQIGGVDRTTRKTRATLEKSAKLVIRERLLTEGKQQAHTDFEVTMNGEGSSTDLVSRSVARGDSYQAYRSKITGQRPLRGPLGVRRHHRGPRPGGRGAGALCQPRGRGPHPRGGHRQDRRGADYEAAHPGPDRRGGRGKDRGRLFKLSARPGA